MKNPNRHIYTILLSFLILLTNCQAPDFEEDKLKLLNETLERGYCLKREKTLLFKQIFRNRYKIWQPERVTKEYALTKYTIALLTEIEKIKKEIRGLTVQNAEKILLGTNRNGLAYQLKEKILAYRKYLSTQFNDVHPYDEDDFPVVYFLAAENEDFNKNQAKHLDFAQINFQNTSVLAMLTCLTQLQMDILQYERSVLINVYFNEGWDGLSHLYKINPTIEAPYFIKQDSVYTADFFLMKLLPYSPVRINAIKINGDSIHTIARNFAFQEFIPTRLGKQDLKIDIHYTQKNKDTSITLNYPYYVKTK